VTCPTLILWGTGDRILPLAQAHRLANDLPNARLVLLDDVGHTPQLEAPERVTEEILGFLEQRDR
jgi:pimeloyl-ACP methyl ester carboxylesterase